MTREPTSAAKICVTCGSNYPGDALFCPNDGTPLQSARSATVPDKEAHDPYLGREISGHIQIRQLAGVGAMGRVYRAFQTGIDRDVAVKILHRELSSNEELVARFTREAKVASRLQHPNVVQVLLSGRLPDDALYIVMEYLDGMSLQSALAAASGAFPLPRALHIAYQLCDAAGEAHAQGIVHRDLKPENVMLVRRGEDSDFVKVLDFGIARVNWGEQTMATAAGLIFGTARYISPEGAQGAQVGPPGDVYSIATLLYQMVSGRTPFEGAKAVALLIQQIHDPPPHLSTIDRAKYIPREIADVIMRNLAKNPVDREPDARALGRALLRAARASGFSIGDTPATLERRPLQLPPTQSTKPLALSPSEVEKLQPAPLPSDRPPPPRSDPFAKPPTMETFKWSPPSDPPMPAAAPFAPTSPSSPEEVRVRPSGTEIALPMPAVHDKPFSNVDTTLSDADADVLLRRRRWRRIVVGIVLVFGGFALYAALSVSKPVVDDSQSLRDAIARATDALQLRHYVEPSGENVLEITDAALQRWPKNAQLLDLRERAADALVTEALTDRYAGHLEMALKKAKDAHRLDDSDTSAIALASQYSLEIDAREHDAAPQKVPPLAIAAPTPQAMAAASDAGAKATLDSSVSRARVGQSVEFVARISTKGKTENPELVINGPGVRDAHVPATSEGPGLFRGRFAFLEAGTFEVVFSARSESGALRASKQIVVGELGAPAPAPTGSVKWM